MSYSSIINAVVTLGGIFVCFYFAHKIVRGSQEREKTILNSGLEVRVTILSMKQSGLFINNNPVVEMALRVKEGERGDEWLIENHKKTVQLIALDGYQVGNIYQAKTDEKRKELVFAKDNSGRPIPATP